MTEKLKPCPFCGGRAFIATYYPHTDNQFYCIECSECGIQSAPDNIDELVTFWNNRVNL